MFVFFSTFFHFLDLVSWLICIICCVEPIIIILLHVMRLMAARKTEQALVDSCSKINAICSFRHLPSSSLSLFACGHHQIGTQLLLIISHIEFKMAGVRNLNQLNDVFNK